LFIQSINKSILHFLLELHSHGGVFGNRKIRRGENT